jgi:hypothetical protein
MFKTFLAMSFACLFFNVFSMQNPCKAWEDAMQKACQNGVLNRLLEFRAMQESKKAGCKAASVVARKECKKLFAQANATAYCPRLLGVVGSVPYYRYDQCTFVKELNK